MRAAAGGDRRRSQSLRRDRHDCRHPCGAILLAEIDNGIALANVAWLYQNMIVGAILVVAVAADYFRRQRLYAPRAMPGPQSSRLATLSRRRDMLEGVKRAAISADRLRGKRP